MSENNTKNYKLIKVTPCDVYFTLHPVSNYGLTRLIHLTHLKPQQALPEDWALGIFQDDEVYNMYKKGIITFDDNEALIKAAFDKGVYFDDTPDFMPRKGEVSTEILATLKSGNRQNILAAIEKYGKDDIAEVAKNNADDLTQSVISLLENTLKIQLIAAED